MSHKRNAGYSLIEVLVAMALLGVVLISIITLFYMGRRNVYSGKQQTKITAVGTRVMEDLAAMTAEDVLANFAVGTPPSGTCVTINNVAYTNCVARNTATFTDAQDVAKFLTRWKALLRSSDTDRTIFTEANITLIIRPWDTPDADTLSDSLQVTSVLQWREGSRVRYSTYVASKLIRPRDNLTR